MPGSAPVLLNDQERCGGKCPAAPSRQPANVAAAGATPPRLTSVATSAKSAAVATKPAVALRSRPPRPSIVSSGRRAHRLAARSAPVSARCRPCPALERLAESGLRLVAHPLGDFGERRVSGAQ